ncbi:respirasome Complex Assembly Factor 1-like isoform X1 [Juglans regia]|uniref:Respirasome Complex Assembly Factor 1-like isoform X1 n=1 Tax=Juglans regia TaxID=51240 RepID=A0A6P9EA49_JUGRE|nr:respirasome Complex Assembly Factor 1-like isoform X1 [Juglans regia]
MKEGKSVKFNVQPQHQNGHLSPFKFAKLLDPEASWDKDQLGDVLHWIRQVVALICGLLWGAVPLVGGIWLVMIQLRHSVLEKLHITRVDLLHYVNIQRHFFILPHSGQKICWRHLLFPFF